MRGGKRSGAGRKPGVKRVPFTGRITAEERTAILAKFGTIAGAMRFLIQAAGATGPALPVAPRTDFEQLTPALPLDRGGEEGWCESCRRRGARVAGCLGCRVLRTGGR
jgi:hypothetical protein